MDNSAQNTSQQQAAAPLNQPVQTPPPQVPTSQPGQPVPPPPAGTTGQAPPITPPPPPPNPQLPNEGNKKKISIKLILILIILLFIITIASTGFIFRDQITSIFSPAPSPTPSPIITITPTPDPMSSWKTYMGDGFSFAYPPEWNYERGEDGTVVFSKEIRNPQEGDVEPLPASTSARIKVTEKLPDETLDNWVENEIERRELEDYQPVVATIIAAGVSAIEMEFPSRFGEKLTVFMDNKNVYVITLEWVNDEEKFIQEEFKSQILSTFEFEN